MNTRNMLGGVFVKIFGLALLSALPSWAQAHELSVSDEALGTGNPQHLWTTEHLVISSALTGKH